MKKFCALLFFLSAAGFRGCRSAPPAERASPPVPVRTVVVGRTSSGSAIAVPATTRPLLEADVSAQIIAPVETVTKREGDRFRRGDVLVRLQAPALRAAESQARGALESALRMQDQATAQAQLAADTLSRYSQLRERRSVTPYELDQKKTERLTALDVQQAAAARVAAARGALASKQADAADAVVRAPFDGFVTRRLVDPGILATPGTPLLHLQSSGQLELVFNIPEMSLHTLRVGSVVAVASDPHAASVSAVVTEIAPAADPTSHSFFVRAKLPLSANRQPGTVLQVLLPEQAPASSMFIPDPSIVHQGGLDAVLIVGTGQRAAVRYVTLGRTQGSAIEVLTGLHAAERIILEPSLEMAGKRVEVLP